VSNLNSAASPLPLSGKTVLVTRSAGQSSQFTALLQAQGAVALELPTLEIVPPSSWDALDQAIAQIHDFDWLILTSANGVDYFFQRWAAQAQDSIALQSVKIAVVGKKTAASLSQQGWEADFIPSNFVADSLVEQFPDRDRLEGLQILFPRVESGGREVLVKELTAKGARVVEVPAYESGCARTIAPNVATALSQAKIDIITFASSKTVRCFWQLIQSLGSRDSLESRSTEEYAQQELSQCISPYLPYLSHVCIASIGPQTSATCEELLGRVDIEAMDYTLEGLTQAIVEWSLATRKNS
jgi:uroporphyrinogen-III synthase